VGINALRIATLYLHRAHRTLPTKQNQVYPVYSSQFQHLLGSYAIHT